MTIKQLFTAGVTKIRQPQWNPWAYAEVFDAGNGFYGPWLTLYDIGCNGTERVLIWEADNAEWEAWTPPDDYEQRRSEIYAPL